MEQTETARTGNVIGDAYKYERIKFKKGGKSYTSQISGDAVSRALLGADDEELSAVVAENGLAGRFEREYPNQGMYRMAVGQALRGKLGRNEPVLVKGAAIKTRDQKTVKSPFID